MKLKSQKRLASQILKTSRRKVQFNKENLQDIKEAITRLDIRSLIKRKIISAKPKIGTSRARIRKNIEQKRKGRRKGPGSRKGSRRARLSKKRAWILKVRAQRDLIKMLKDKNLISAKSYKDLYNKSKGGFFRSKRHVKLYINENELMVKK